MGSTRKELPRNRGKPRKFGRALLKSTIISSCSCSWCLAFRFLEIASEALWERQLNCDQ